MSAKVTIDIEDETGGRDGTYRIQGKVKKGQRANQFTLVYSWGMNRWNLFFLRYSKQGKTWCACADFPGHSFFKEDYQNRKIVEWLARNLDLVFAVPENRAGSEIESPRGMIRVQSLSDNNNLIKETGFVVDDQGREREYLILIGEELSLFLKKDQDYWIRVHTAEKWGFDIDSYEDGTLLEWMCDSAKELIEYKRDEL